MPTMLKQVSGKAKVGRPRALRLIPGRVSAVIMAAARHHVLGVAPVPKARATDGWRHTQVQTPIGVFLIQVVRSPSANVGRRKYSLFNFTSIVLASSSIRGVICVQVLPKLTRYFVMRVEELPKATKQGKIFVYIPTSREVDPIIANVRMDMTTHWDAFHKFLPWGLHRAFNRPK